MTWILSRLMSHLRLGSENYTVSEFRIILCHKDGQKSEMMLKLRPRKGTYDLSSKGVALLNKLEDLKLDKYSFANFFPVFAAKGSEIHNLTLFKASRELLRHSLERLVYIAPLRVAPVLARTYNMDVESHHVLPDGENTRFIIDSISGNTELIGLLKYWICKRFQLAKDISIVKETGKRYRALITTNEGLKVDLMHMGFGLSQILPIVTQGCISVKGSTLIVEDPDVHMHPSIQAAMADFFIFLSLEKGVTVLIETHSDHFITRIRRRVAEGGVPTSDIHLIFVENEYGESIYQSIPLSNKGKLEGSMPNGFLDSLDADFRAYHQSRTKMKIVIAPHIYSSSDKGIENTILYQLVMTKLPSYVSILVPISWEEYLANHPIIASSYELFSLLLDLSVEKFSIDRKAEFIKLQPDILGDCDNLEQIPAKQHIFALCKYDDCKRLYSYVNADTIEVNVSIDRKMKSILHFNPEVSKMDLSMYIQSFSPVLNQLKHDTVSRQYGDKYISAFSAYDRNDERYAKSLLQRA